MNMILAINEALENLGLYPDILQAHALDGTQGVVIEEPSLAVRAYDSGEWVLEILRDMAPTIDDDMAVEVVRDALEDRNVDVTVTWVNGTYRIEQDVEPI